MILTLNISFYITPTIFFIHNFKIDLSYNQKSHYYLLINYLFFAMDLSENYHPQNPNLFRRFNLTFSIMRC